MPTTRIAARTVFFPENHWTTLKDKITPELRNILVFEGKSTPEETINQWLTQVRTLVNTRETIENNLQKINTTSFQQIFLSTHRSKQIFLYFEKLWEKLMVLPFISVMLKKEIPPKKEGEVKLYQSIKIFPSGAIILKTITSTHQKSLSKKLVSYLKITHNESVKNTPTVLTQLIFNKTSLSDSNNQKSLPLILKKTGTNLSAITRNTKNQKSLVTKDSIKIDNSTGISPSFKIMTNRTRPIELVRNVEEVIDLFYSFLGASDWLPPLITNDSNWSLDQLVNYYSLIFYIFNPSSYYVFENPILHTPSLLRLSIYRQTWKQMFFNNNIEDPEKNYTRWKFLLTSFLKPLNSRFLIYSMFLDKNIYQIPELLFRPNFTHNEPHFDIEKTFPKLSCREAVVFALFIELARAFFVNKANNFREMLKIEFPKIHEKIELMRKIITKENEEIQYDVILNKDYTGWISPNFFRQYLIEKKPFEKNKDNFPKNTFNDIPNKDCDEPILTSWHPTHFSKTPGKIINGLISKGLVDVKKVQKNKLLVRANLNNYLVKTLILK